MAEIKEDFASGGSNLVPQASGSPSLATILRGVVDDLNGLQVAAITSDNATDLASAMALVNEIKATLNVIAAYTITTTKG